MRDDFGEDAKRILAARVGNRCSNPRCRALTSGPQDDPTKALNVGIAAHITAASPGGPRYDSALSPEARCQADNGIWLCQTCGKLVDNDVTQFPAHLLRAWKTIAEHEARYTIGKTAALTPNVGDPSRETQSAAVPPKPKHNIRLVETAIISAHADGNKIFKSPQNLGDFKALVACFRNEPAVGVDVEQPRLKAHIIYRDNEGNEISDANRGVWIERSGDTAYFDLGNKRCIVVFLLSSQGTWMKLWNETYTTQTSWMADGPLFKIRQERVDKKVSSVEVNLLSHDRCVLFATFDVKKGEDEQLPELVLRAISEND
jgi:hypothetical protein